MKILVLCTGNSCRSQMAQGFLQKFLGYQGEVYSAGIEAHGLNARAVKVMEEIGVSIAHHTSNKMDEYFGIEFDWVITVCDNANETCPYFPRAKNQIHHSFQDPAKLKGDEDEILPEFRRVRDEIRLWSLDFIDKITDNKK